MLTACAVFCRKLFPESKLIQLTIDVYTARGENASILSTLLLLEISIAIWIHSCKHYFVIPVLSYSLYVVSKWIWNLCNVHRTKAWPYATTKWTVTFEKLCQIWMKIVHLVPLTWYQCKIYQYRIGVGRKLCVKVDKPCIVKHQFKIPLYHVVAYWRVAIHTSHIFLHKC